MSPRIAILGSFRKHWNGIAATAAAFRSLGCEVLSPAGEPVNPDEEFVRVDSDGAATDREIVFGVLAAVDQADAVYFYNPDGYLGASAAVEMGYCLASGHTGSAVQADDLVHGRPARAPGGAGRGYQRPRPAG